MTHREDVERFLQGEPRVAGFRVAERDGKLHVDIRPAPDWIARERAAAHAALSSRMLKQWQMVYDKSYRRDDMVRAPNFDAWISSFTGAPIPLADMQTWLDHAVAEMRRVPHGRVLEVGCGVGLIAAALAPGGTRYLGLDFSQEAIGALGTWVATRPELSHVRLACRAAHELDGLDEPDADLAILNSVVQYFPDADYFKRVLDGIAGHVRQGGAIFLGDLRAPALLPMRALCVAAERAQPQDRVAEVRAAAASVLSLGREFAVDPAFFVASASGLTRLGAVRFSLKPPATDRELSGYRYDAMLHLDVAPGAEAPRRTTGTLEAAMAVLEAEKPPAVAFEGLANARLARDRALARALRDAPPEASAADVMAQAVPDPAAIEPEAFAAAAAARGYETELRLTPGSPEGGFDALVRRAGTPAAWPSPQSSTRLVNDPLGDELATRLRRELQAAVETALGQRGIARVELSD